MKPEYNISNARNLQEIPVNMDDIPEIKKAFNIANQANLSLDELEDQEKREIFIQDHKGAITKALSQGREEGREKFQSRKLESWWH